MLCDIYPHHIAGFADNGTACRKTCHLFYVQYFDGPVKLDIPGVPHTSVLDPQQKCEFIKADIPAAHASS